MVWAVPWGCNRVEDMVGVLEAEVEWVQATVVFKEEEVEEEAPMAACMDEVVCKTTPNKVMVDSSKDMHLLDMRPEVLHLLVVVTVVYVIPLDMVALLPVER